MKLNDFNYTAQDWNNLSPCEQEKLCKSVGNRINDPNITPFKKMALFSNNEWSKLPYLVRVRIQMSAFDKLRKPENYAFSTL